MARRECDREAEVLDRAGSGRMGDDLSEHIVECETCRDLVDVAAAVLDDRAMLMRDAHPPGAGLVWWRANMRVQREAARTAVRTGSFIQAVLLVVAVLAALAYLGVSFDVHAVFTSMVASLGRFTIPLLALAAWLILAPVAVYFAVTEE